MMLIRIKKYTYLHISYYFSHAKYSAVMSAYLRRWRGAKCYQAQAVPGSESQSASGSEQRGRAGAGASDILSSYVMLSGL